MLQALACSFSKKETLAQVLSCEFCKISKNAFLTEYLRWLLLKGWSDFQTKGERERERSIKSMTAADRNSIIISYINAIK